MSGKRVPKGTMNVSGAAFAAGAEEGAACPVCTTCCRAGNVALLASHVASVRSGHVIFMSYPRSQLRCAFLRRGCRHYTPLRPPHNITSGSKRSPHRYLGGLPFLRQDKQVEPTPVRDSPGNTAGKAPCAAAFRPVDGIHFPVYSKEAGSRSHEECV